MSTLIGPGRPQQREFAATSPDITLSATFTVRDSALTSSGPTSDMGHSVDGDSAKLPSIEGEIGAE
jgi:hypothetical protein